MAKPDANEREGGNYRQCYSDNTRALTNNTSYFAKTRCHRFSYEHSVLYSEAVSFF